MTVTPPSPLPTPGGMVTRAPSVPGPPSKARRGWALTGSIILAVLSSLLAISAAGIHGADSSTFPPPVRVLANVGAFLMIGVSVLLIWRHRYPTLISTLTVTATIVFPTTPLPALIAVAAVTAVRTGRARWALIIGTYVATAVSFTWDVLSHVSLLSDFVGEPAAGTPARLALLWAVPILAAVAVATFAGYGIIRRVRAERDTARLGNAAAARSIAALHQEVSIERERQELARELHDTLAARLSSLSLHAGALELTVDSSNQKAANAARVVRESAQSSLDDLRNVVHVLRNPADAGISTGIESITGLIDDATRDGTDIRAQLLVTDPTSCHPQVAHACYRLVQESLSNARRHAPGAIVRVEVRGGPATGITVSVANWLTPDASPSSVGGGHGLTGMGERVTLVGGSFQAGPTPDGTFAVVAWLPWQPR